MKILMLPGAKTAPAARFRVFQLVAPLQQRGYQVVTRVLWPDRYWQPSYRSRMVKRAVGRAATLSRIASALWITRDIEQFDAVLINRDLVPESRIEFLEPWLCRRNPRIIFDFDDAIFLGSRESKFRHILPEFAAITAGNRYLAEYAAQYHKRVEIWPTVVDTDRFYPRVLSREPGPIRIGWSGSRQTLQRCLPLLGEPLSRLALQAKFEFVIVADAAPKFHWPDVVMRFIPWRPETEVEALQSFDLGVMPLLDEPFERGKCGAKALTYMAASIPAVVSPVGVNQEIVVDGVTGFHCRTSQEWEHALLRIVNDEALRLSMGHAGRIRAEAAYSVRSLIPKVEALFENLAGGSSLGVPGSHLLSGTTNLRCSCLRGSRKANTK